MPTTDWKPLLDALAAEVHVACEKILQPAELRLDDASYSMLAEEDYPVVPHYPIGMFYSYRLTERRTRHLFGRRWLPIRRSRDLARFGMEEMWHSPSWSTHQGLWCAVMDDRLVETVRPFIERFSAAHALKLDFAPRAD